MASWPEELPQSVLLGGYEETSRQQFIRTEMDAGPVKQRRRYTAAETHINADMILTDAQMTELEDFWDIDLQGGSLEFTWVHPRTGEEKTFRFREQYSFTPITHNKYRVSLSLEILP